MKLKDSETFKNLARAYAGECQARTRYEFVEYGFRYNGYESVAQIIDRVAYQEFHHARMIYTLIQDAEMKEVDNIDIEAGFPFKEKWQMIENLRLIAEDEKADAEAYAEFIEVAEEEGFEDVVDLFQKIMEVELQHQALFEELYNQFSTETVYKKDELTLWVCPNCGYATESKEAWDNCPLCQAKQGVCEIVLPENIIF